MSRLFACLALIALTLPHSARADEKTELGAIEACIASAKDQPARSCIGKSSDACQEKSGDSTMEGTDDCISRESDAWDTLLNEAYQKQLASAKALDAERKAEGDEEARAASDLVTAQRAWIAYRDAECYRRFEVYKDGTIRTTMSLSCTLDLTALRALDLQEAE